jgi:hypothetical protein
LAVVAVLSAVAMSKVTPPGPAGAERLTVKKAVTVPASPSVTVSLSIESESPAQLAV